MKNYVERGLSLTLVALAAVVAGAGCLIGHVFGVAKTSAEIGEQVVLELEGVYDLKKHAGDVFGEGDLAYWDDVDKSVTSTAAGNKLIGAVTFPAAAGDVTVRVRLNGVVTA